MIRRRECILVPISSLIGVGMVSLETISVFQYIWWSSHQKKSVSWQLIRHSLLVSPVLLKSRCKYVKAQRRFYFVLPQSVLTHESQYILLIISITNRKCADKIIKKLAELSCQYFSLPEYLSFYKWLH